jgi:hypothetical protein
VPSVINPLRARGCEDARNKNKDGKRPNTHALPVAICRPKA